jgi:hypothetical protein
MQACAIRFQSFQPIAGRRSQITQNTRLIEKAQLPQSRRLNARRQFPTSPTGPDQRSFWIREASDYLRP